MKSKKLLAFLLSLVIIFAGLPTITSSASEAYTIGKWKYTYTTNNRTQKCYSEVFTVNEDGVLQFQASRLIDKSGSELLMTYNLYEYTGSALGEKVWTINSYKFDASTQDCVRLVGLESGTYVLEVCPSIYSSSFPAGGSLTIYFGLAFVGFDCYEKEANDVKEAANSLSFNKPIHAYADHTEDYYSITVSKDTPARIKIKNYATLVKSVFVKFISATNESEFLSSYKATAGKDHYYFDVMLRAGTNYINVTSFSKGQIDYSLEVSNQVVVPTPVINNLKISGTKVEVSWNQLTGITGYEIWRKINNGSWQLVLNPSSNTIGFWQSGTNFKNSYQFKVRAYETVGGKKLYSGWSKIKSLNPTPTNIKLSASSYTYNGKTKTPTVKIKDKNGKPLTKNVDYKVTYASGRKKIGKYKVTVTFIGNYTGKKTLYFKINPKGTSVSKVTAAKKSLKVKLKKQTSQTSGYQIQYSTSKKFKSAKSLTVKGNKNTSATIKKLKAKKTYYVRVRTYKTVDGTKYYSGWSNYKTNKTK